MFSFMQLVMLALEMLPKMCHFNVISFGTTYRELFQRMELINGKTLKEAKNFVKVTKWLVCSYNWLLAYVVKFWLCMLGEVQWDKDNWLWIILEWFGIVPLFLTRNKLLLAAFSAYALTHTHAYMYTHKTHARAHTHTHTHTHTHVIW